MTRKLSALLLGLAIVAASCRREEPSRPAPSAAKDAVVVRMSYGSEKKGFIGESVEAFHRANPKTSQGKPIRIEARAEGSAEPMEAILARSTDLHVWSPASSLLVDVLNDRALSGTGLGASEKLVTEAPPLVLTPVVVAMWEPMARALGWPEKAVGWGDLARFASEEGGWSRHGKLQFGDFKLGHTHPSYSNSGAVALVAATYAGAGKSRDLTLEDVEKAAPFVKRLESKIVHYGRSTGFFAEKMYTRGPGYLSAAVLYENLVAEAALNPAYQSKPFPVVALYPKEGTFWCDNPFAILNLPGTTPEVREAAESFRAFLLSRERQEAALSRFGYRPADPAVPLGSPIDAAHGLDPKEPQNLLPNPPLAVTRRILESFESVKRPVSITFVLDVSGSMKGDPLASAKAGARVFLESLPPADSARVLFFSSSPRWVAEEARPLSQSRAALAGAIDEAFAEGGTALYDAIQVAIRSVSNQSRDAIRAVVVLTDGRDTDSRVKKDDLLARLRQVGGPEGEETAPRVFTIAYGGTADPKVLKEIAEAGGGAFFEGTPKNIRSVYAELASFF